MIVENNNIAHLENFRVRAFSIILYRHIFHVYLANFKCPGTEIEGDGSQLDINKMKIIHSSYKYFLVLTSQQHLMAKSTYQIHLQ